MGDDRPRPPRVHGGSRWPRCQCLAMKGPNNRNEMRLLNNFMHDIIQFFFNKYVLIIHDQIYSLMVHFVKETIFLGGSPLLKNKQRLRSSQFHLDATRSGAANRLGPAWRHQYCSELIWQKYSSLLPQDEEAEVNQLGTFA